MIRIQSKKHGFRRCGVTHPEASTDYKDDFFSDEQLAQLKAEPMLLVQEVPNPPKGKTLNIDSRKKK